MKQIILSFLALLCLTVSSARAQWTGGTYTATTNEKRQVVVVYDDATLTINPDVTITVYEGIRILDGKTLTITGSGTLVVTGVSGAEGNDGGAAIQGNVIINGVTVVATGGQGGDGTDGNEGTQGAMGEAGEPGGQGGMGGQGGSAFSGNVIIYGGTITATGGQGGNGGKGGTGGEGGPSDPGESDEEGNPITEPQQGGQGGEGGWGGDGGTGGYAFAGTVTFYGGLVYASGGFGGWGGDGGDGGYGESGYGSGGVGGSGGDLFDTKAFENDVTFGTTNYTKTGDIENDKDVIIHADNAIPVTAKKANGAYWSTFYSETCAYKAPEGTQVFSVKLDDTTGEITLTEVTDRIASNSWGVVLKQTTSSSAPTTTIVMVPNVDNSSFNYYLNNNSLVGTTTTITNPGNAYVLSYKAATGVGFYKLKSNGTIAANRAYLTYSGSGSSTSPEFFEFSDEVTRIREMVNGQSSMVNDYYDLQGRKVANPQRGGIYIRNGKKVIF